MTERKKILADDPSPSVKEKLRQFADHYRGGSDEVRGNATNSYMAVHPRCQLKTARCRAVDYLNHPITQAILREKTEEVSAKADIQQEKVLTEIARLGLYDVRKLFDADGRPLPINQLEDDIAAAIVGVDVVTIGTPDAGLGEIRKYRLANKNDALEKLMKYLGAYEKDNRQKNESLAEALLAGINRVREQGE